MVARHDRAREHHIRHAVRAGALPRGRQCVCARAGPRHARVPRRDRGRREGHRALRRPKGAHCARARALLARALHAHRRRAQCSRRTHRAAPRRARAQWPAGQRPHDRARDTRDQPRNAVRRVRAHARWRQGDRSWRATRSRAAGRAPWRAGAEERCSGAAAASRGSLEDGRRTPRTQGARKQECGKDAPREEELGAVRALPRLGGKGTSPRHGDLGDAACALHCHSHDRHLERRMAAPVGALVRRAAGAVGYQQLRRLGAGANVRLVGRCARDRRPHALLSRGVQRHRRRVHRHHGYARPAPDRGVARGVHAPVRGHGDGSDARAAAVLRPHTYVPANQRSDAS